TMIKVLSTSIMAMLSATAMAQTKADTLVVTTTPEMHCEGCENKIKKNIRFVKGTKKIETSVPQQSVTIIYDGRKATYADFEAAFRKIGYEIKEKE
ncbi:MAG: heavy-metal-associated domain-containing protein, partial [Prevotella sp.]|nr:heavy-metal-associated domain-containing protein [Prevotella sp.]